MSAHVGGIVLIIDLIGCAEVELIWEVGASVLGIVEVFVRLDNILLRYDYGKYPTLFAFLIGERSGIFTSYKERIYLILTIYKSVVHSNFR